MLRIEQVRKYFGIALFLQIIGSPAYAGWSYKEQTDPFTDGVYSAAYGSSRETYLGEPSYLAVMCYQGTLKTRLISREHIGTGKVAVQYRVDKATPVVKAFRVHDDNKLELPTKDLLQKLKSGSKFVIEIHAIDGRRSLSTVSLNGSSEGISRVERNCRR